MAGIDYVTVTSDVLDLAALTDMVGREDAGAISTFIGTTRNSFKGREVVRLEYEAYGTMAEKQMKIICATLREKFSVINIAIAHRIGVVPVRETSVIIAVSSAHRIDSLQAVHYGIDAVKELVPIWKKEFYADGSVPEWKENCEGCTRTLNAH
ncbi:molybdopterin converting factor, subunit 2 [Sphaeroforma arctica JP610]|uniref:Molybdopterin synthase catalytic subunit n=1 Tax=Sphaeroforma arctica JP610 TaxID=667725 RepID=A0A0L0G4Q1_9EUKA|nr:molybdopterin converting factor, subunit 2 [Sphaeroforma arctica JP610]KNC83884.1 molybdopterin converting factor, subunit 2 [Sphaeroforma arctica JP610]|eukprot:XP_014157786.1 molybdopterin converting factor, subunit 2 [Sphaeroforma arctica JP610]